MIKTSLIVYLFFLAVLAFSQNYDAELINHKTNTYLKNGKLCSTKIFEIKINNRAGEKYTKITIPHSKMKKVSKIVAYIKNKNQNIIKKLKKSEIKNRSDISNISFYEDNFVYEFTLKHNIYPYYIYYSYQIQQEEFLFIDYWLPVLDINVPTLSATLNVELPKDYKISFTNKLIDDFEVVDSELLTDYTWHASYKNVIEAEKFSAPIISFLPTVIIVPQKFKYELDGSLSNWVTFGDWEYELIQNLSDLPQHEKNRISFLIVGIDDDREKIKKLYHDLQDETRYINITIETGGLRPFPASYVVENKYGDCKALTNYFKSVLEYINIQSYYTSVYAGGSIIEVNKELPSQQFNHVILCVPVNNDTLWLDCTSKGAFNKLGTFTQNRDAYIIKKNESHFTKTPSLQSLDVLETRIIKIHQNQQDDVIARFCNTYKGENYETLLSISNSFNQSEKSKIIQDKFIEKGFEVNDFSIVESHRDSAKIQFLYSANSNNIFNKYGDEILIKLIPFSVPQLEKPVNRKLPVQFDYPNYKVDSIVYLIPEDYHVSNKLTNMEIVNEFGKYKIEFKLSDNKIRVVKSFLLNSGYYTSAKYESLYNFINEVNNIENKIHIVIIK